MIGCLELDIGAWPPQQTPDIELTTSVPADAATEAALVVVGLAKDDSVIGHVAFVVLVHNKRLVRKSTLFEQLCVPSVWTMVSLAQGTAPAAVFGAEPVQLFADSPATAEELTVCAQTHHVAVMVAQRDLELARNNERVVLVLSAAPAVAVALHTLTGVDRCAPVSVRGYRIDGAATPSRRAFLVCPLVNTGGHPAGVALFPVLLDSENYIRDAHVRIFGGTTLLTAIVMTEAPSFAAPSDRVYVVSCSQDLYIYMTPVRHTLRALGRHAPLSVHIVGGLDMPLMHF
jgi:hypothetical protein